MMTTIKNLSLHKSNQWHLAETSWYKGTSCPTLAFLTGQSKIVEEN